MRILGRHLHIFPILLSLHLAMGLTALPTGAALAGDPDLVFSTIHTEHFDIHFHREVEPVARRAATIAEEVHDELTVLFGWQVEGRTQMVLTDSTDAANGMAMAAPSPYISLYVTAPDSASALAQHDRWMRTLIIHEYTHVIHLQMHGGISKFINAIFGDVYLPNQMIPRWFIEGLAVLQETNRGTSGRIRSAFYKAVIRMNALEGHLQSLGEASNSTNAYPRGQADYIYGAMFMEYLATRFGEDKIIQICHEYGSSLLPYGLNRIFKRVLGVDLVTVYEDWRTEATRVAQEVRAGVEAQGATDSVALTQDGEGKDRPIFTPDSKALLLSINDGEGRPGIFVLPVDGGAPTKLALSDSAARVSMDAMGHIYFTRSAPYKNYYRFMDLFTIDRPGAEPRRITHGARVREAAVSPGGSAVAMVVNAEGSTRLVLADDRGNIQKVLVEPSSDVQVYDPAWSPDGRFVSFIQRTDHQVDVFLASVKDGKITKLTDDRALESGPAFDPSGRYVLYSSDLTGIANIYARDLSGDETLRLTNVVGAATYPAVSPDGQKMAFLSLTSRGWDVHMTAFDPDHAPPAETYVPTTPVPGPREVPDESLVVPYNPLPSFLPRSWMLGLAAGTDQSTLQAVVNMADALRYHNMNVALNFGLVDHVFSTQVGYLFQGMNPGFSLGFSRTVVPKENGYSVDGISRPWNQEIVSGSAGLSASLPALDRDHSLSLSYSLTHARPSEDTVIAYNPNGDLPQIPTQYFRAGVALAWSFSDLESSVLGISPEGGRTISATARYYHPSLGGNQTLAAFGWNWTEYLEAPWLEHHVFALRLTGGVYVSDPPRQASFRVGGYQEQNFIDAVWNYTPMGQASLRGYPPGSYEGDQFHVLKLEYRFPLWLAELAYESLPLFFRRLHAAVFTDNALIAFGEIGKESWKSSVGGELVWSLFFGYHMPITMRTGYARGLMDGGSNEFFFIMGGAY